MADHPNWPPADRLIQNCMDWLAEDLYRERPHKGGYAMENPPGNIRVEFDRVNDEKALCRVTVNDKTTETENPSLAWLEEACP